MENEKKFYDALQNIFVGAPIEGEGGYVNLLKIKERYYEKAISCFKTEVSNDPIITDSYKEDFYNLLFSFFNKYFSECGSVYFAKTANWQRIYEKVYTDNKDVVLFWKTHMLYYVKSDILFKSIYVKSSDDENDAAFVFYFDVGELKQKQNNEKKELVFKHKEIKNERVDGFHDETSGDRTFVLSVEYSERGKKTDLSEIALKTGISENIIDRAIAIFKKQTTVDFFINKNAKRFLEEQLELFLHQYLLDDDSIFDQTRLSQIKAVKKYAKRLIGFISQFENELVRIWNKPKFVRNSNYVITLDRLPRELIEKILRSSGISQQTEEWIKLGFVKEDFSPSLETIKKHPHLPVDTKFFKEIELDILALFDNIDEALDGRLIHSENYQALNTIKTKYAEQIQCVYIDPPFNTGKDFAYLDGYQDASWLNIMNDRLILSHDMLNKSGGIFIHLDRYANYYSRYILNDVFGKENYKAEIYWDTCGDTGFKTSKNNWYQNTNVILQYAKDETKYKFNKLYTLLNVNDPKTARDERKSTKIGWLDIFKENSGKKQPYIMKYVDGKLSKQYPSFTSKVEPIGMIWTDVLSFLYTQVGNNESYFFNGGQKPESLIARIIQAQTEEGNYVMDYFAGIGTTPAVAHKLHRKYIAVEMGDHFNTFYDGNCRIGILGRMKNVLNGDSTFYVKNPNSNTYSRRAPQLTRNINWQGGGFFKYFDLEQYEDTLDHAVYSTDTEPYSNDIEKYVFFSDKKFSEALEVTANGLNIDLNKLYDDIDLPETISLLYGKPIERIDADSVKLKNIESPIKYNAAKMTEAEKIEFAKLLKPLLWWGE